MSELCHEYATAIDACRQTLEALAITAGVVLGAGIALTVFTAGASDAARRSG